MSSSASLAAIHAAEVDRLARLMVPIRAARIRYMVIPVSILWLLEPSLVRLLPLALALLLFYGNAMFDMRRVATQEVNLRFVSQNIRVLATGHMLMVLVTGGFNSPFLPVLVVLPMAATVIFGRDASLVPFFLHQIGLILFLALSQIGGLTARLSPSWLAPNEELIRTLFVAGILLGLLKMAHKIGSYIRALFDRIGTQAVTAQADLLATHQAQAEELTALSGAIAHELKNPLASIKGLAGLLARDIQPGKPAERLKVLREEVDRMQGTLEEFLNFSRPLTPTTAIPTALRPLVESVVALHEGLARGRGLKLVIEGEGSVRVDPRKTRQILINLLQNAIEASAPNTTISLTIAQEGQQFSICIDDEGVGIDPNLKDRIFLPGMTTKAAGNGLGLTIARGLARQQGGELSLAPRASGGTQARLVLPGEA